MFLRRFLSLGCLVAVVMLSVIGCVFHGPTDPAAKPSTLSSVVNTSDGHEDQPFAAKPVVGLAEVVAKVYTPGNRLSEADSLQFASAISGSSREWEYGNRVILERDPSGSIGPDDDGEARFKVRAPGYYWARLVRNGVVIGEWASIPASHPGRDIRLMLVVGKQAQLASDYLSPQLPTPPPHPLPPPSLLSPMISTSVPFLLMDTTAAGSTSRKVFTISNTGTGTLDVKSIIVTGTDASQFTVSPTSFKINPGDAPQVITVAFTPTTASVILGARAFLCISHNAMNNSPLYFILAWMGVSPSPSAPVTGGVGVGTLEIISLPLPTDHLLPAVEMIFSRFLVIARGEDVSKSSFSWHVPSGASFLRRNFQFYLNERRVLPSAGYNQGYYILSWDRDILKVTFQFNLGLTFKKDVPVFVEARDDVLVTPDTIYRNGGKRELVTALLSGVATGVKSGKSIVVPGLAPQTLGP